MQRLAILAAGLLAAGCGREETPTPPTDVEPPIPEPAPAPSPERRELDVLVYVCSDGARYSVAIGEEAALLLLPDSARRLPRVPAASGARYAAANDEFWNKGEEAALTIDGVARGGCVSDRMAAIWESARMRGVDYRAVGNEPGWLLEIIEDGSTRFEADYGELTLEFATPAPRRDPATGDRVYLWSEGGRTVELRLRDASCQDTMASLSFPLTVSVELDGRRFEGCGRALAGAETPSGDAGAETT